MNVSVFQNFSRWFMFGRTCLRSSFALYMIAMVFWGALATTLSAAQKEPAIAVESITVTAQKREGHVQKIPASVSVLNDVRMEDFTMDVVKDITAMIPNFYVTDTGSSQGFASMRGIGASMTGTPTVGIYVDDVYTSLGLDMALLDAQRVEVLRGPQGTLYGRNSEAGVINVVTKKPGDQWEGKFIGQAESFDTYQASAVVSGPLLPGKLGFRGALRYLESDGWFENRFNGSDQAGNREDYDGRFHFSLAASEHLDFQLIYDMCRYKSPNYANFALLDQPGNLRKSINVDYMGKATRDVDRVSLHGNYDFGKKQIVSITSFGKEKANSANDVDFMPMDIMNLDLTQKITTISQEFRLISKEKSSALQWLLGAFFLHEDRENSYGMWMNFMNMGMGLPGEVLGATGETTTTGGAVFGEATCTFGQRLHLTLGLRYDREEQEFDYNQPQPGPALSMMGYGKKTGSRKDTHDAWLPKAAIRYDLSREMMPYASISRGFRSGGYNTVDNLGSSFAPEFTWNYEAGVKTSWLENRLQCNLAVFYIDWTDMQVEVPTAGGASVYVNNAAKAATQGVEVEVLARPLAGLDLFAGAGYTQAEYDTYSVGAMVYDKNTIADVPEMTFYAGGSYRFGSGCFASLLYQHVGKVTIDVANTREQEDYGLLSAKIGYEGNAFDCYVFARNLLDEDYTTRQFDMNGAWYGRAGEPLVIGVSLGCRF